MTSYTDTYDERDAQMEEGSMSFLDHLDELRKRLIRVALFVMAAFVVCWIFSEIIYGFLQVPVQAALFRAKQSTGVELAGAALTPLSDYMNREVDFLFPTDAKIGDAVIQTGANIRCKVQPGPDGQPILVTASPVVVNDGIVIPEGYEIPHGLYASDNMLLSPERRLVVGTVQGAFNLYIKVSFYAAIFFGVPFILAQIWGFVAPGLYPHEKKYAAPIIAMASVFFLTGCAFAYYIAFPRAANFLLGVAAGGNLRPLVTADDYFDLIIMIMLGLGIVFEIPTVTFFGARLGLISSRLLLKIWRYAVIA